MTKYKDCVKLSGKMEYNYKSHTEWGIEAMMIN